MLVERKEEESHAHISCPHCGAVFAIDESECAQLLSQIKSEEMEIEIQVRLEEAKASLKKANEKAQDLTIKKLTKRSPSLKAKFEAIDPEADSRGSFLTSPCRLLE